MAHVPSLATALEGLVDDPVAVHTRTQGPPPFAPAPPDDHDDGDRHGDDDDHRGPSLRNARLGVVFLTVQGYEWAKLIGYGLTLSSGVYGATFYTLIGCHGLHVLGAVVWLLSVWLRATHQRYTATRRTGVVLCGMYWSYVVGLWPVL